MKKSSFFYNFSLLCESPRWLLAEGRFDECVQEIREQLVWAIDK